MTSYPNLLASPVASGNELASNYPNLFGASSRANQYNAAKTLALNSARAKNPFLLDQSNQINQAIPRDLFAPPVTTQTARSATQAPRIAGLGQQYDQTQKADQQSLADWTKNYLAGDAGAKANTAQETGAVGSFYGSGPGSVTGDLNRLATRANSASNLASQQALAHAQRQNNLNRMIHGNGSFTDNAYAGQAAAIAVDNARRKAAQDQANYQYVKQGQMNFLGQRNNLQDSYLNRGLVPIDTSNQILGQQSNLLGGINSLENQNSVYQTQTPDEAINRRISLLNSLQNFQGNPSVFNQGGYGNALLNQNIQGYGQNTAAGGLGPNSEYLNVAQNPNAPVYPNSPTSPYYNLMPQSPIGDLPAGSPYGAQSPNLFYGKPYVTAQQDSNLLAFRINQDRMNGLTPYMKDFPNNNPDGLDGQRYQSQPAWLDPNQIYGGTRQFAGMAPSMPTLDMLRSRGLAPYPY